jgi:hypothetical protein
MAEDPVHSDSQALRKYLSHLLTANHSERPFYKKKTPGEPGVSAIPRRDA